MSKNIKYKLISSIRITDLGELFEFDHIGSAYEIRGVSNLAGYGEGILTFCLDSLPLVTPGVVICDKQGLKKFNAENDVSIMTFLVSETPKLLFSEIVNYIEREIGFINYAFNSRISSSALIHDSAVISPYGCIIEDNVVIGENVVIRRGVSVGSNSLIQPGCVLGEIGFGFTRNKNNEPIRFPHLAGLTIGKNVEIGSLSIIDRGSLSDTIIGDHVKINNFSMIGHGVNVNRGSYIHAGCTLSGGSVIGELCWVGPSSSINNKVSVGERSLIGTGSIVNKDLPANGVYVGSPARYIKENI